MLAGGVTWGLQVVFLGTPDVAARALEILLQASEEGK